MATPCKTTLPQTLRSLSSEGTTSPSGGASATRPLSWALLGAAIASTSSTGATSSTTNSRGHAADDENTFRTSATIPSSMVSLPYQPQPACFGCTTTRPTIANQAMLLETIEAVLDIVESDFDFDNEDDIDSFGAD